MLALMLAAYLQHAGACCTESVQIPKFSGTACKTEASSETMIRLYARHAPGDEQVAHQMVTMTHQCARVLFGHPLFVVYRGTRVWGINGMAEVQGFALGPTLAPFMYAIMSAEGRQI